MRVAYFNAVNPVLGLLNVTEIKLSTYTKREITGSVGIHNQF